MRMQFELLTVLCLLIAPVAFAQQSGPDADQMFQQLDANKDGKITLGEGGPGSQQMIRQLFNISKKKDSESINRDELRRLVEQHRRGEGGANRETPQRPMPMPNSTDSAPSTTRDGGALMRLLDANNDGKLSRAELSRIVERFNDLDRNNDGQLDDAELQTAVTRNTPTPESEPTEDPSRRPPNRTRPSSTSSSLATRVTPNAALQTRLAGTWRGWVVDGRGENPNNGHMEMELRVEGNRMSAREVGTRRAPMEGLGEGTFTIAGTGNTGTLDADQTTGQHKGRHYPGIFEIDGETLKWCVNNRDQSRPTTFESGRGNYYMILRRQR